MFRFSSYDRRRRRQGVPVLCEACLTAAIDYQQMAGGKFLDSAKKSLRRRGGNKGEIVVKRFFVYIRHYRRMLEDRFDLGSEDEPAVMLVKVERLDSCAITRQHQPFAVGIPKGDGIVTLNFVDKIEPTLLIEMQNCF